MSVARSRLPGVAKLCVWLLIFSGLFKIIEVGVGYTLPEDAIWAHYKEVIVKGQIRNREQMKSSAHDPDALPDDAKIAEAVEDQRSEILPKIQAGLKSPRPLIVGGGMLILLLPAILGVIGRRHRLYVLGKILATLLCLFFILVWVNQLMRGSSEFMDVLPIYWATRVTSIGALLLGGLLLWTKGVKGHVTGTEGTRAL